MRSKPALVVALAVPALAGSFAAVPAVAAAGPALSPTVRVIASHLDNPRGLSSADGRIVVAEAGHASPSGCITDSSTTPATTTCLGRTGTISSIAQSAAGPNATLRTEVAGLISKTNNPGGIAAEGPVSVSATGDQLTGLLGLSSHVLPMSSPPALASLLAAAKAQLGHLVTSRPAKGFARGAAIGNADYAWAARHKFLVPTQFPDANPNAVLRLGALTYVIDSGSNTLDTVKAGRVVARTFFPAPSGSMTDAVPTCIDRGSDGALYVGELLGGTFAPGGARVWRVAAGTRPTIWAKGLTTVNGCGFGRDGAFYATEFQVGGLGSSDPAGDVVRITNHGSTLTHVGAGALLNPSGFAAGSKGVYVSNCSISPATGFGPCPGGGQLVRLQ